MRTVLTLLVLFLLAFPVSADTGEFSVSQREIGPIIVTELTIRNGILFFRTDSGGCTDAASFVVDIEREDGISAVIPHYRLTIRRVCIDECKALLWDGVLIELDLEKDLGLTAPFSVSVENPVYQGPRDTL
ncbi:MAG: hypothetical protein KAU31_05430 [Spirochaetaceae bacterium]|nr:hypothetical protein [Spirochaetaceae bacterium]